MDAFGQSDGWLANPDPKEFRVDLIWPEALDEIVGKKIVTAAQANALQSAFDGFHSAYGAAIDRLLRGAGIGAPELFEQAEAWRWPTVCRAASRTIRSSVASLL